MSKTETDTVPCIVVDSSTQAWLIRDKQNPKNVSWFPKSQIHFERRNVKTGEALAVIPLWLLTAKNWNA